MGLLSQTRIGYTLAHDAGTIGRRDRPIAGFVYNKAATEFANRELDILELLAERYRHKEIASRLFISSHTVNYHLKYIYKKLDVFSRRLTVLRAGERGILRSTND